MDKKIIKQTNTSFGNITLTSESAWYQIQFVDEFIEMPFDQYTLQEVMKRYTNLVNLNAENIEYDGHYTSGLGYVSQKLVLSDAQRISKVLKKIGLKNRYSHRGFHFTLQYDKRNPIIEPQEMERDRSLSARIVGVELLAPDSPVPALALIFESDELQERFDELVKMGFVYDYDEYLPHITVKYRPEDGDLKLLQDNLQKIIDEVGEVKTSIELWKRARD